jgi:peptidoglycan/LPS O-acetylase OafA/YrhL
MSRVDASPARRLDASRSRHVPALDGLRGVAVFAVLCYHGALGWMRGGFLGVSTFFTLSGFLIAGLVHDEIRSTGRFDFRRFWSRRVRRLLPAALLTLAGIVIFRGAFGAISYGRLRGDVLAALGYIENWWLVHTHQTYGSIFATASPVQHFWSLAIEEQFYVVFPIVCYALHRVLRRANLIAAAFGLFAVVSLFAGAWLTRSGDVTRAYYGADTRAAELLVGVTLAYVVTIGETRRSWWVRLASDSAGLVSLGALVVLWSRMDLGSTFLFRGGLALNAVCTAVVVGACLQSGLVAAMLSFGPFRLLGRISYGVYLVHWPIFLWLTSARLGMNGPALFVVRSTVTIVVAAVLFVLVEYPIRARVGLRGWAFGLAAVGATLSVALAAMLVSAPRLVIDLAIAPTPSRELHALAVKKAPGARRVLVVGDSLGWTVFRGLQDWGLVHHVAVGDDTVVGCGAGGPGTLEYLGIRRSTGGDCAAWHASVPAAVALYRPDVVVVVMGLADLSPRQFPNGEFLNIGNPTFDRWLASRMSALTRTLASQGAHVVWATYPHVDVHFAAGSTGPSPVVENDPTRVDRLNALIKETVASTRGSSIVDFGAFCYNQPGGEFAPNFRPDGVHLDARSSLEVASWLGPQLTSGL